MAQDNASVVDDLVYGDGIEEDFNDVLDNTTEEAISFSSNEKKDNLSTHRKLNSETCGTIIELENGYSKTTLLTTKEMSLDELGLIHSGFIFGAADYAAAVAVNEPNVIIIGSNSKFLAPAKVNDIITFEAKAKFEDSRKREIKVTANINEIKVFEGLFHAVVLENHIFKTKIKNAKRSYK